MKKDKELEKLKKIAEGVAMIQGAREDVERLVSKYDEWIDEAAQLGEDAYSDQLIDEKLDLADFARDLSFIEVQVRSNAVKTKALSEFKRIDEAMTACRSLLKGGPNLKKLGSKMSTFRDKLSTATTSIKDLRTELSKSGDKTYVELFGERKVADPKLDARREAEKKAREARLSAKIASDTPSISSATISKSDYNAATDIDELEAMIIEENKKK